MSKDWRELRPEIPERQGSITHIERTPLKFQAYCPDWGIRVAAVTMLTGNELHFALHSEADIAVIHTIDIDHLWKLKNREKITLRDRIASGTLSIGA